MLPEPNHECHSVKMSLVIGRPVYNQIAICTSCNVATLTQCSPVHSPLYSRTGGSGEFNSVCGKKYISKSSVQSYACVYGEVDGDREQEQVLLYPVEDKTVAE